VLRKNVKFIIIAFIAIIALFGGFFISNDTKAATQVKYTYEVKALANTSWNSLSDFEDNLNVLGQQGWDVSCQWGLYMSSNIYNSMPFIEGSHGDDAGVVCTLRKSNQEGY
jgi:hypothetical protein